MAWIKVDQRLPDHPKVWRAARILRTHPLRLVGHLVALWTWALDYVPSDGTLGDVDATDIKRAAQWEGNAQTFVQALLDTGLLDDDPLRIHDWREYAGPLIERREYDRKRQRQRRDKRATTVRQPRDNGGTKPDEPVGGHAADLEKDQELREIPSGGKKDADEPRTQTYWETELRRAKTPPGRDQIVLEAFHWQHGVLPLRKKRQALLAYCRSYGHAHVLSVVFQTGDAFPDHPEAYVLKVLATPPARTPDADQQDLADQADQTLAYLEGRA